jgi:hypothetical protein
MRRSTLLLTASVLLLTACVDTTGVQKESTKGPRGNVKHVNKDLKIAVFKEQSGHIVLKIQ